MTPTKKTPRHQGHQGERTSDTRDDTQKPEIDAASWAALGKPSRDRRQKKTWRRKQHGAIDAGLAAWLLLLAVTSLLLLNGWPL